MYVTYLTTILNTVYKVPDPIDPERSFMDLGVDSLSLAELGAHLEDELGVTVDEEDLSAVTTVSGLAVLLESQGAVIPA
ncbi:acyl carrier protein [Streptomyces sp. NPDC058470]|uniref:acyl carrier protein n=1 Tax=Streptomyces sp. NPDC058470 TaxID=3346515 RepID=UPI00365F1246